MHIELPSRWLTGKKWYWARWSGNRKIRSCKVIKPPPYKLSMCWSCNNYSTEKCLYCSLLTTCTTWYPAACARWSAFRLDTYVTATYTIQEIRTHIQLWISNLYESRRDDSGNSTRMFTFNPIQALRNGPGSPKKPGLIRVYHIRSFRNYLSQKCFLFQNELIFISIAKLPYASSLSQLVMWWYQLIRFCFSNDSPWYSISHIKTLR